MSSLLSRVGASSARHPWRVILAVVLSLLALGGLAGGVGAGFSDEVRLGATDSQRASDLLTTRFPAASGDTATVVVHADAPETVAQGRPGEAVRQALATIATQPDVAGVTPLQVSPDGSTGYAEVLFASRAADLDAGHLTRLEEAVAPLDAVGVEASMRGPVVDRWRERPVPVGEVVGILAALVLVTLLFRSAVATLVTVGAALVGLALGNAVLAVVSGVVDIPTVAPTIAIMLGLGAGIDYALFLVARFRARLRAGDDVVTAAATANSTTGTAVITAAAIVVVSICGLYVTGITIIGRMGLAAAIVVAVAALVTVVLVPSLLRLAGRRVLPRAERAQVAGPDAVGAPDAVAPEGRRARRVAEAVARRPRVVAGAATVALLALASPALGLTLGQPDDGNRPVGDTMRTAYDRLTDAFGPGFNGPLVVAVDLSGATDPAAVTARLDAGLAATDGVQQVSPVQTNPAGDTAVVTVIPTSAPQSAQTSALVERLRDDVLPSALTGTGATAHVGGQTATFDDLTTKVGDSLWLLIAVVVGTSVVLLTFAFRSVVLPLVSAGMNLLSIAAAYGVVTLVFQTQLGTSLLGIQEQPVVSFVPMLMFAILFGLSMDYNVFLLSAVQDERAAGHSARAAVPRAVGRTSALITTAGAIMTLVFLGFSVTDETEVRMIGIGLATAVLVDVTVVRLFLAPALLELLGERAWWMPSWLARRVGRGVALAH
ncbi:MAG TPA: MMPL family transporter [Ornithinibacter sp.]|nr:MMPL family transporter [Ornithinibacter sp.]